MFTGKGGVGKTTCSAASALHYAADRPTLAISTDATPSLLHIFEADAARGPVQVLPQLYVKEIGGQEIRQMWDAKFGREVHEVFSAFVDIDYPSFVEFMTSILPGLGEEFMVDFIREESRRGEFETIVWDTAPLGQTLGLLETPALLAEHLRLAPRVYSKLRFGRGSREPVLDILRRWERLSAENMTFLRHEVEFTIVTIPEALAVAQLDGAFQEMARYGLHVRRMIINNVVKYEDSRFLQTRARQQKHYLKEIREKYGNLETIELPMFPQEVKGVAKLKQVERLLFP
jgi:arsenite-transporting ATPase